MKKNKTENGITLVALIITIIVLLILAVVAIGVVTGEGILFHAKDAASKYAEDAAEENTSLKGYRDLIIDTTGEGPWKQEGMNIKDGNISLKIGDKVNYDELSNGEKSHSIDYTQNGGTSEANSQEFKTENLEWRVLGVNEKGQLELISNKPTEALLYLRGETGYLNGVEILNETCNALYGQGQYAASGRSLKVEDVNKLANYTPAKEGKVLWRFSDESTYVQYSKDGGKTWVDNEGKNTSYKVPGRQAINSENPGIEEVPANYYEYTISMRMTDTDLANLITKGEGSSDNIEQGLASRFIAGLNWGDYGSFGVRILNEGKVLVHSLYESRGWQGAASFALRPVVTLKASVEVGEQKEGVWQVK